MVPFKKIFSLSTLTLLVALSLSAIAAWYSIQGLVAIFAAAVIPIMIMGGSLELAKVVTTLWLHTYWDRATLLLKLYLVPAVVALALLTSMGIFGFLSKAHSDQSLVSGDAAAKLAIYDEKIKTEKDNIETARKALQQMDAQVDARLNRSDDDKGAERAVQIRKQQAKERADLQKTISDSQNKISQINEERAPVAAENRKVEAEVGPIKYIAALIYGDNPDSSLLERAVRWVIILIVFVFDPLALTLVLASTSSYEWMNEEETKVEEPKVETDPELEEFEKAFDEGFEDEPTVEEIVEEVEDEPNLCYKCNTPLLNAPGIGPFCPNKSCDVIDGPFMEEENVTDVQTTIVEPNGVVGEELPEQDTTHADEPNVDDVHRVEPIKNEITEVITTDAEITIDQVEPIKELPPQPEIRTEGVTLEEVHEGYVQFEGKSITKHALQEMRPDLFRLSLTDGHPVSTNFGTQFPKFAEKGSIFVRVDVLPNRVYKFDGNRWIETNKEQSDSYLYDEQYIQHLIHKIDTGEYDVELLSDKEKSQIESYLSNQSTQDK